MVTWNPMTLETPAHSLPTHHEQTPVEPPPEVLISVRNVSKSYLVFNESIDRLKQAFWGRFKTYHHTVHSLRDISFELRRGRSLGIIGRNGSGKSTLLQLIAGTLSPTGGEVRTYGRIAALLELGSGFNPEFTGRENVFLNGTIMGLSRAEMEAHYQQIIDFADIGEFIDMPVKTYSSGMMLRLAFATAINVNADVLIVDEALAVGDASFQEKCYARLKQLIGGGTTLLFVSHDSETVSQLCSEALLLEKGETVYYGEPKEAVDRYFQLWSSMKKKPSGNGSAPADAPLPREDAAAEGVQGADGAAEAAAPEDPLRRRLERLLERGTYCAFEREGRWGDRELELIGLYLLGADDHNVDVLEFGQELKILIRAVARQDLEAVDVGFQLRDLKSLPIVAVTNHNVPERIGPLQAGQELLVEYQFPMQLRAGHYCVVIGLGGYPPGSTYYDWLPQARILEVVDTTPHQPSGWGLVMPPIQFGSTHYEYHD